MTLNINIEVEMIEGGDVTDAFKLQTKTIDDAIAELGSIERKIAEIERRRALKMDEEVI